LQSLQGHREDDGEEISTWLYSPSDAAPRISQQPMPVHINLWLFRGLAPKNGRELEVVIHDLKEEAMNFRQFPKSLGVCSAPAVDGDRLYQPGWVSVGNPRSGEPNALRSLEELPVGGETAGRRGIATQALRRTDIRTNPMNQHHLPRSKHPISGRALRG
jgi:hypothetical protein